MSSPSVPALAHVRGDASRSPSLRPAKVKQTRPSRRKHHHHGRHSSRRTCLAVAFKALLRSLSVTSAIVILGLEIAIELLPIVVHDQIAATFIFITCCTAVIWDMFASFSPRSWRAYRIKPKTHVVAEMLICILAWVSIAYIYGQADSRDVAMSDPNTRGHNNLYSKILVAFMAFLSVIHLVFFGNAIVDKRRSARAQPAVIILPPLHPDPELSQQAAALQDRSSESMAGDEARYSSSTYPRREWQNSQEPTRDPGVPRTTRTSEPGRTSLRSDGELRRAVRGEAQAQRVEPSDGREREKFRARTGGVPSSDVR